MNTTAEDEKGKSAIVPAGLMGRRRRAKPCALSFGFAVFFLVASISDHPVFALERLEPPQGCYLGFSLRDVDSMEQLNFRLGITPAVYHRFFDFPLSETVRASLTNFFSEVLFNGAIALISLEPWDGLDSVSPAVCEDLATLCATYEQLGIDGIMIRFAHEMNGHWYAWGQQPLLYKEKFRLLADNIHSRTTRTAMLWAPNYGLNYPFGKVVALAGSAEFIALDTDGDGVISSQDDPYEPYYPGDDAVDWVGMTIYHWGTYYPWIENELPLPNSFCGSITGTYQGTTPNFYARYCADGVHNKPIAIPETAAFYNTQLGGARELEIKQAWWRQVFNISGDTPEALDVALHFPKLKCITWFDQYKLEGEARSWIDWRVSVDERIRAAFLNDVRALRNGRHYFLAAQGAHWQHSAYALTATNLPVIVPPAGPIPISLSVKAQTNCDLVIDLLDTNFQWQAGIRLPITAGIKSVPAVIRLMMPLHEGSQYWWSIFLTSTGGGYKEALARYGGRLVVARNISQEVRISGYPPVLVRGSNFNVRVKYVAGEPALAVVNVLDNTAQRIAGGSVLAGTGDGCVDVAVTLPDNVPDGAYWLEALLSDPNTNLITAAAHSQRMPVLVSSSVNRDFIRGTVEPAIVPVGEVFRFQVGYSATTNRDLHIDLFDANTNYLASAFQAVPSGSGLSDLTISLPTMTPGGCFITVFMTPAGESWTNAVAWGSEQRLSVVAAPYYEWIQSHWGIVLQNDPVYPEDDSDGDGAPNAYEFLTQTDPRNAQDVLKLKLANTESGLVVRWSSVAGLSYQLLESASLAGNLWTPVGQPLNGNGTVLEVAVSPPSGAGFYRVKVLP
jgi:hypothetical protein